MSYKNLKVSYHLWVIVENHNFILKSPKILGVIWLLVGANRWIVTHKGPRYIEVNVELFPVVILRLRGNLLDVIHWTLMSLLPHRKH